MAQSYVHDMVPASQLGIARVWVNRLADGDDPSIAHAAVPDLRGLLPTVETVAASAS